MIFLRVKDKRYKNGYNIVSFKTDIITEEIVQFVKDNPNAYFISGFNEFYATRTDFLKKYDKKQKES